MKAILSLLCYMSKILERCYFCFEKRRYFPFEIAHGEGAAKRARDSPL